MKCLTITLYSEQEAVLPLAYNHILQGVLYNCWKESYPNLHDASDRVPFNLIKLFVYSPLVGGKVSVRKKELLIDGLVSFEVRSPHDELVDNLTMKLKEKKSVRLGRHAMQLVNLQQTRRILFPSCVLIRTVSPVTVHRTCDDGHIYYYAPDEDAFYALMHANITGKLEEWGIGSTADVSLMPVGDTFRKCVTKFKGTWITGWDGSFILEGEPEAIELLYHCGIGARNSQGFGMFNIVDKPL